MSPKTKPCDKGHAAARLNIAERFMETAEAAEIVIAENPYRNNSIVSNYVQAGIAASDAICCADLREHHMGESHAEATGLLRKVKPDGATLAKHLGTLLGMKTNASYGSGPMKDNDAVRAKRAAEHLVNAANARVTG